MHPKDAEGIVNSADPDLGLHCCPDLSVRKLMNITVHGFKILIQIKFWEVCIAPINILTQSGDMGDQPGD